MTAHDTMPSGLSPSGDEIPERPRRRRPKQTVGGALVSLLAELLIIAGAGTGLYVLWTAWWTDVVAVNEQTALVQDLKRPRCKTAGTEHREAAPVLAVPPGSSCSGTMQIPGSAPRLQPPDR